MRQYYDQRADEYERIYARDDPVRQSELARVAKTLRDAVVGRRVLEIACGTGYWTAVIAEAAEHVLAIDTSTRMLAAARRKRLRADRVEFRVADAYALDGVPGTFDAAVAIFWLSHVSKARLKRFLAQFHARLAPGATVFLADNMLLPDIGGELISPAGSADTYKLRTLDDGSKHEILKNYYTRKELRELLRPWAIGLRIHIGTCFWWLTYTTVSHLS